MSLISERKIINLETALALVTSVINHAQVNSWSVAVVVADPWGAVTASARMDGVSDPILEFARDKAYTAATLGKSTEAFQQRMASDTALNMGLYNRDRVCAWPGGLPLYYGTHLVGGIGVSGAEAPDDIACAEVAIAAMALASIPA